MRSDHLKQPLEFNFLFRLKHLLQLGVEVDAVLVLGVLQPVALNVLPQRGNDLRP